MRLIFFSLAFCLCSLGITAQSVEKQFPKSFSIQITNPLPVDRESVLVVVSPEKLKKVKGFNTKAFVVLDGTKEIASQYNETDLSKGVVFVLDKLAARESKKIVVRF